MKSVINFSFASRMVGMVILLSALVLGHGCKKESDVAVSKAAATNVASDASASLVNPMKGYKVVNLVSDAKEYSPLHMDDNLVNAWGLAFGPTGGVWVSSTERGLSTIYDQNGNTLRQPVVFAFGDDPTGGEPTGMVFNSTGEFMIPPTRGSGLASGDVVIRNTNLSGTPSRFIFSTENGTIAAWGSGNSAVTVADRSTAGAIYKGLEMAMDRGEWFLYATDFHNGRIDVFDGKFNMVIGKPFMDPSMPEGFAPFNIRKVGENLVVTYAKQHGEEKEDDEAGAGNGYVNIFSTSGRLLMRFASGGVLNSPWGIEVLKTNMGFGSAEQDMLPANARVMPGPIYLIGNFGDGRINAFDSKGNLLGPLMREGTPIEIEGLWAISYPPQGNMAYHDARNRLYFTAGPDGEEHGVFGYVAVIPSGEEPK